jgi:hypothetical protein
MAARTAMASETPSGSYIQQMSANEQSLFQEGYASALAQKMENLSDRTNVTNQISNGRRRARWSMLFVHDVLATNERFDVLRPVQAERPVRRSAIRRRLGN